jgi:3-deoxy-manno-octulosonate cytidylyltransferase (CMP-KDO synthetase)
MIAGRPMIQWVYQRALAAGTVDDVIVATDDRRILEAVQGFGGKAELTSAAHASGTDRIAEVAARNAADVFVNVQGDEPLLPATVIDGLVNRMLESRAEMGTVAVPIARDAAEFADPNCVKVVCAADGRALYFSRAPIPFSRDGQGDAPAFWHWGLYAYTAEFLQTFVSWPESRLERTERLEQLRAMDHGVRPLVLVMDGVTSLGVDTPEDVAKVEHILRERGER